MPSDDAAFAAQPISMTYPRPTLEYFESVLPTLKEESKQCIQNLVNYRATRTRAQFPRSQSAAVLVPLFVGRSGDLYVLLSRRSEALRTYAGDTALPGGRIDPRDVTMEDTAVSPARFLTAYWCSDVSQRREAFEETGLPQDRERVPLLCVMEPHLAGGEMVVTPVVVLVLDKTLQPNLNSSEVTSIFSRPLASFLSHFSDDRPADASRRYHTFTDLPWSEGGTVRLHRFLTGREAEGVKPIFGLTASILIKTATIGYGHAPDFEVQPPNAPTSEQQIAHALLSPSNPLRIACEKEGVNANRTAARMLRPHPALNAARTIEWENIGADWKRLMEGGPGGAAANGFWGKGRGKGGFGGGTPGGEGLQKRIDEIKKRVQERVDGGGEEEGTEGLGARIEEFRKRALERKSQGEEERKERGEERSDAVPDIAKLGEFLDRARDMVNERMKEVAGDEKKLAKARKAYPKIMEELKKQFER
ncbi:hypothetical protein PAXRUDRAFT_605341 [Paxillus rubicundulus Ve08.2h10]|uniref:Nudix hydrolase domain-containing protein n=1 Tax=Paxillus rubicundulus Ve08.2h10 TaxID=930991 RepID=A0A0D0ECA0_9AGAM|nr:hypothetical protein PAXRUDRAFT_605341 [Paxillus rubicundulus Ve08.2h10]